MAAARRARAREEIVRLVHRTTGPHAFAQDVARILSPAVPFDGVGLMTVDPATLLPTSHYVDGRVAVRGGAYWDLVSRFVEIELREPDFNKFSYLVRQGRRAASLHEATQGDLHRSTRYRELRQPLGFGDDLRVVCSDGAGAWGDLFLARGSEGPRFTRSEIGFLASLAPVLAEGVRRAVMLGEVLAGDGPSRGLLILAPDNSVETETAGAERLLAEVVAADVPKGQLPVAVLGAAAQARRIVSDVGSRSDDLAWARVRTAQGDWVTVRGSVLGDGADSSVAVLMEKAQPPELAPLIADAYGLTERERRVTELVAKGLATNDIGKHLHLSAYTVQDHLKSIFDKTGTGSRGELVARLFFDHYAPRLQ